MRGLCAGVSYCVLEVFERGELRLLRLKDPWAGENSILYVLDVRREQAAAPTIGKGARGGGRKPSLLIVCHHQVALDVAGKQGSTKTRKTLLL